MSFYSQLHQDCHSTVSGLAQTCLNILSLPSIGCSPKEKKIKIEGFWVAIGTEIPAEPEDYILTPSIRKNLKNLARIVSGWYEKDSLHFGCYFFNIVHTLYCFKALHPLVKPV